MSPSATAQASRDRVRGYRDRLRRLGLRPIQIWVPDTRSPEFAAEAHRHSAAVAASPYEPEDRAFIDAISGSADR
jgi:DNA-binding LacI/PurR family transcriptional regulator